jgi:predicted dehydrogenase
LEQALPYVQRPLYNEAARYSGNTFRSTDVGVVLDLMIHDLDVALTLIGAPVVDLSAIGFALMGRHEDVARARLHFSNGTIVDLSASRVSYQPTRQMQIWSEAGHVNLDFATRSAVVAQPSAILRERRFDSDQLPIEEKARLKDRIFEELIPLRRLEAGATNALLEQQRDFVSAIRSRRQPRVTGSQAREVVAVAERIQASIANHRWQTDEHHAALDASPAFPAPTAQRDLQPVNGEGVLRGPHWHRTWIAPATEIKRPA